MKRSVVTGIRSIECSKNMCSPCMGCHHAIARPNEKKLTDIIEFRCNKLQWLKIYGNLARNFKVNGILSKLNFSSFQIFFNSKVPLYRDIGRVQNLKILFPVRQASAKEIRISSATSSQTNNTVPAFNLYFQSEPGRQPAGKRSSPTSRMPQSTSNRKYETTRQKTRTQ